MQPKSTFNKLDRICKMSEMEIITDADVIEEFLAFNQLQNSLQEKGLPALRRLVLLAETQSSGQVKAIALILAGLYNGDSYPFPLTTLRGIDINIFDDILAVIRMDSLACKQEIHTYFENGDRRFHAIFENFQIKAFERKNS